MSIHVPRMTSADRPLDSPRCGLAGCILAAGVAKRLEPISAVIAKPAFPLAGRVPIAETWVRKLADAGIDRMVMNLHRVPESVRGYFGDGRRFLAEIDYVYEESPSGTLGGAIRMIRRLQELGCNPQRVFIPSGDIVSGIGREHLEEMVHQHQTNGAAATMMLAPIPWDRRADFGTVALDKIEKGSDVPARTYARIVDFLEKVADSPSNENNASNYLIETDFLLELEDHLTPAEPGLKEACYDFGKHVFMGMQGRVPHLSFLARRKDQLFGYEPGAAWYDVGNKRDYLAVNNAVLSGAVDVDLPYTRYPWGFMGDHVEIDFKRTEIEAPVVIGSDCTILPGARLGPNAVIGDGWVIHRNAEIRESVLWSDYSDLSDRNDLKGRNRIREVLEGVRIEGSIVVGGVINRDAREQTIDVLPNGDLNIQSIDWVPAGPRA